MKVGQSHLHITDPLRISRAAIRASRTAALFFPPKGMKTVWDLPLMKQNMSAKNSWYDLWRTGAEKVHSSYGGTSKKNMSEEH